MLLAALLLVMPVAAAPLAHSLSCTLAGLATGKNKLTFDARGNFKVVSFSDMHFGEGEEVDWGPQQDVNTSRVHSIVLDNEKPNYVVFNGDLITGENVFADNATKYLDQMYAPTVARNVPFSSTHGNHDNTLAINHQEEIDYEQAHYSALSHTRSDVGVKPWGSGNYWVPVYAKKTDVVPAVIMWFFDSRAFTMGKPSDGNGPIPDAANFYWVDENVVPQYIKQQSAVMELVWKKVPPALVFVHIPVQKADILAPLPSPGDHDDEPDPATQGFLNGTYTGLDVPFWNALVDLDGGHGTVLAVTSGHDHGESWCARAKASSGVPICFNGHSGYGGYVTPNSQVRNARVFELNLGDLRKKVPVVRTWNSYENSTITDEVVLGPEYMKEYN
ncbi:Metallo-dependent phosphatase-like protein [Roridomyces roridus]|uniref:Metallo-dependent phosphatase-like protein n=1 Tax=Roridomyces roridus TaxID=1738132 RepID=A0AAD7C041_9AGAR|nr:Metallo-dependent phosphatase-like protein [Roridomyces roridus]